MGYGVLRVAGVKPEMIAMGIIDLRKFGDHYLKLRHIHERVLSIIESYLPDELAIEIFFGKNVQSMLKLGRAQGVAMAAALSRDIPITEYAPLKIKIVSPETDKHPRNRWQTCCSVCCIFLKRICLLLWMQRTGLLLPIVTFCRWGVPRWRKAIMAGKTLLPKIRIR